MKLKDPTSVEPSGAPSPLLKQTEMESNTFTTSEGSIPRLWEALKRRAPSMWRARECFVATAFSFSSHSIGTIWKNNIKKWIWLILISLCQQIRSAVSWKKATAALKTFWFLIRHPITMFCAALLSLSFLFFLGSNNFQSNFYLISYLIPRREMIF